MTTSLTLSPSAEQLRSLQVADGLFYERGITGVTMAQIRDQSGLSMRRLYSMYPTKADLITAWLQYRHHTWLGGFRARVARHIDGGMAPVDAVFEGLEAWMVETNFRGCGFVNAHAAGQGLTEEHNEIIRTHKAAVADYLGTVLPDGAAVAVLFDGAMVLAAIFRDVQPIRTARRTAADLAIAGSR